MIVPTRYEGASAIHNGLIDARVAFATNTLREAVYLRGTLAQPVLFREALSALYDVVVSDLKYRPRDRFEFRAWLEEQDRKFLANLAVSAKRAQAKLLTLEDRLAELNAARRERMKPFHRARYAYFNHVYQNQYELNLLMDPVITVHPDEISFEAFSRDESTYARIGAKFDLFQKVDAFECGTTNIDFSSRLHNELLRMRSYRATRFDVEPSGFAVATGAAPVHKEKKIDLPQSWVDGFLQVHSTMSLGLTRLSVAPVDLYNVCRYLRRRKAKKSPRALRYELVPGERVKVILEPWEREIRFTKTAVFEGPKPLTVRTWGRDRLRAVGRLLPLCRRVDIYLAGFGLPSIYVFDLGPITFTVALSGWTDNDWTGGAKFDLLARRLDAGPAELTQVYEALRERRLATDAAIAAATGLGTEKCRGALSFLCQSGRAMFDLGGQVFRHRELFMTPFSAKESLKAVKEPAPKNQQEQAARQIIAAGNVRIIARRPVSTGHKLSGSAKGSDNKRVRPLLHADRQGHIIEASCTCSFFKKSKLTKGPCEHILALRLAHMKRLESEDQGGPGKPLN